MSLKSKIAPPKIDKDAAICFVDIQHRAVDGTTGAPVFVDETNQRVIIGSKVSSGSGAKLQVNGTFEVIGVSNGIILTDAGGSGHTCLVQPVYDSASGNWNLQFTTQS